MKYNRRKRDYSLWHETKLMKLRLVRVLFLMFYLFQSTIGVAQSRGLQLETVSKDSEMVSIGTFRALIIGNNRYKDPENYWTPLKTAVTDAKSVAHILESEYGFTDITLLQDASRREILNGIESLRQRIQENDSILLYYAGHGYLDEDIRKGYWVPVDAEGTDTSTFLRNSTIRDELGIIAQRAQHTLLISDSCFSGALLRSGTRGKLKKVEMKRYYRKVANKKSVQIIAAGGIEFVDDNYNNSGHSPFTYFLLNELKTNINPILTLTELSTNVEKAVANNVEQIPESGVLQGAGDELGEFIFLKTSIQLSDKLVAKQEPPPTAQEIPNQMPVKPQINKSSPVEKFSKEVYLIPFPTL